MKHKLQPTFWTKLPLALGCALALAACDSGSDEPASGSGGQTDASAGEEASADAAGTGDVYGDIVNAAEVSEKGYTLGPVSMGNPDAPVTIIEYASLTCPACAGFHERVLPDLKAQYVESGQVRYEFRNFVLNPIDMAVSMIVRCQPPEQFFPLLDLFFTNQRNWLANANDREQLFSDIAGVSRRVGISRADIDSCLADRDLQQHIVEMTQGGQREWDVGGTPTIIVNGQKRGTDAMRFEGLAQIIEEEL